MIKVGVTGGIGSGKSTVCSIISAMGYPVFNADLVARQIVDSDLGVIRSIKDVFGEEVYYDGSLNRKSVASLVFSDKELLNKLNAIIHPAVAENFSKWLTAQNSHNLVFKEAAILFESGAFKGLDKIICVIAPLELRIKRVQDRDGLDLETITKRIKNQYQQDELIRRSDYIIENNGISLILPQIVNMIDKLQID